MVVKTSSISRPGISMTPSRTSNNSRIQRDLASKSLSAQTGRILAPCVVPTKSTRGTGMRQCSDKNYRGIIWTNKRLYKFWHTGEMLSHKGLSFDQQMQKICMRRVRNAQCAANSFMPFSVHLTRKLAGEFHVWHPYHEQQYVCSNWPLTLPDTSDILQLRLLTCDIKAPFLNVLSSESS